MSIPEFGNPVEESIEFGEEVQLESNKEMEFGEVVNIGSEDFGSPVEEDLQEPKVQSKSFTKKFQDYVENTLGKGPLYQAKSGGYAGAPALEPEAAKQVAIETAIQGTLPGIIGKVFKPLVGAAQASRYIPKILSAGTRAAQAATTGIGVATTESLITKGELPSKEDLLSTGLTAAAIDGIFHLAGTSTKFVQEANHLSKKYNVPKSTVYRAVWENVKRKAKNFFGIKDLKQEHFKNPKIMQIVDQSIKDIDTQGIKGITDKPIDITPSKSKPTEKQQLDIPKKLYHLTASKFEEIKKGERGLVFYKTEKPTPERIKNRILIEEELELEKTYIAEGNENKLKPEAINKLKELGYDSIYFKDSKNLAYFGDKKQSLSKEELNNSIKNKLISSTKESNLIPDNLKKELIKKINSGEIKTANDANKFVQQSNLKDNVAVQIQVESPVKPETKEQKPLAKKTTQTKPPISTQPKQPKVGKKQAAKRSDIINIFRKALNDPIRLGKISQKRALGIHKGWAKVSRLLKDNDIETAAHEIGHNLHYTLYGGNAQTPQEYDRNVNIALKPYLDELKPLALYEPYAKEGFAEFVRVYVTNPEAAKALAPKFYKKFEADLDIQSPEIKEALLQAREYYDSYIEGTPDSRIDSMLHYSKDQNQLTQLIEWAKTNLNLDNLKTQYLDDVYPAKRAVAEAFGIPTHEVENIKDERNLYRSLRVLKGSIGKGDVFVQHETFDPDTLERTGEGLQSILNDLPDKTAYKEFNRFLVARRAIEKGSQNIETGIEKGDALVVFEEYKDKYGKLAERLDKYNDQLLQYAKKSGMLSEEQYSQIKKKNLYYTPFQRVMTPEKTTSGTGGKKIQAGKPIKKMKGSTRNIIAPLESVIKNTYAIIVNSEKNRSGQVLAKLGGMKNMAKYIERVPTPIKLKAKVGREQIESAVKKHLKDTGQEHLIIDKKLAKEISEILPDVINKFGASSYPAGENIVTVYFDGKPQYYEVSPEIFEMWTKGLSPYTANLLTKIMRAPAKLLRAGAILNPKFIQKNIIRDTWGGFLFTKYGKSMKDPVGTLIDAVYSPLAGLSQAIKKGPLYVEWLKAGGGLSTMQSIDRVKLHKQISDLRKNFSPKVVTKWLRKVGEISEEANRLSEFARALAVEEKTRLGKEIAAFASRDVSIDFAKMGLQVKAINQITSFFNATIQGGDKLIRTLSNKEDRDKFIPRVVAGILIPSLILAWIYKDDEDIEELQEQEKDFNFVFKVGDEIVKIPVPFETGVMVHGLGRRMFNYFWKKDPEAFEGYMGSILDAALPSFIPTAALPFIEAAANKNFFTGRRIIPASQERLTSRYQYKTYTSDTAKQLGRIMNFMLGEDTRSKAASPAIIDHFINSWTGGLGLATVSITDEGLIKAGMGDKIPKPYQRITDKLGLNAFVKRYPTGSSKSIEKFYDNYQDAMTRLSSLKYAKKYELDSDEDLEKGEERIERLYDIRTLQNAYKAIQNCQKAINNIMRAPDIEPKEKREMVDQLYLEMTRFAKDANSDIRQYILDQKKP